MKPLGDSATTVTIDSDARDARQPLVRLGVIDYLNVAPVYDGLRRDMSLLSGVELVAGVPSAMNAALLAGEIDLSNVSSVAYGQHADEWLLLPGLSVAAQERVESVLLFSWHADWRALDGASIALSSDSATSVALVKLLAEERFGARPRYVTAAPDLDAMLAHHDAALLIGDIALVEGQKRREVAGCGRPYVFDLAAEWRAWTGLPFVFAVWAARADRAGEIASSSVILALRESKRRGLSDLERIAAEAAERLALPEDVCLRYLRLLDYDLGERDLEGLRRFLELVVPGFHWQAVRFLHESIEEYS
jgi:chorismate dehydratase